MSARRLTVALLVVSAVVVPAFAAAQSPAPPATSRGWPVVRAAKWTLLAAAVGLGAFALTNSRRADAAYADLKRLCNDDQERCHTTSTGRYVDDQAEQLFQRSVDADHRARVGIIGGQVALLGSAALFVYDLRNGRGPGDIPYPTGKRTAHRLVVGARLAF